MIFYIKQDSGSSMDINLVWDDNKFLISFNSVQNFNAYFKQSIEERYKIDTEILNAYIPNIIRENSSFDDIYVAVTLINAFYSTRMGADMCYKYAKILYKEHKNIWLCLQSDTNFDNDCAMVQKILDICEDGKKKEKTSQDYMSQTAFSFISKYFSVLSRHVTHADRFPIYDSVVARMLHWYLCHKNENKNAAQIYSSATNKEYKRYAEIINVLCVEHNIVYKELDDYLWNLGRKIEDGLTVQYNKNKKQQKPVVLSRNTNIDTLKWIIENI